MKIGVFVRREKNLIAEGSFSGMIKAFEKNGCDYFVIEEQTYKPCDVAVVFGIYKKRIPASIVRQRIFDEQEKTGKRVLVLERGYVNRDTYHSVGWNNVNGRADFCNREMAPDRWENLDVKLKPWRKWRAYYCMWAGTLGYSGATHRSLFMV